jgi:hypothetical protein
MKPDSGKALLQTVIYRLTRADRAHQRELGGSWLLRCVKWLLAGVAVFFAADVFWHLEPGWRLALTGGLAVAALGLLAVSWYIAYARKNQLAHIARLIEERHPKLGSKIINLIQLQDQAKDAALAPLTRDLAELAVAGYAAELAKVPLEHLARTDRVRRELKLAALALLVFAGLLAAFLPVSRAELARFLDPYGDHPPYSVTQLAIVSPGVNGTNVIYGRSLVVEARHAGHRPKEVFLTAFPPGKPEQAVTLPMFDKGEAGFYQQWENVRTELLAYVHTKDRRSRSKLARVGLVLAPQMERAFVRVAPPAYTGLAAEEKPYHFKGVQALTGSELRFRLQSNRPLREGMLELISGEAESVKIALARSGTNEVSGSLTVTNSGRLRLSLVDAEGIPGAEVWESALTVTHDLGPEVAIADPDRDAYVALDFKMQPRVEATDDYGLASIRIHRALNGVFSAPKEIRYPGIVRTVREAVEFDFRELGVQPGDVISCFAEAIDNAPEAHLARSQTIHFMVISVEEYNNYLRERNDISVLQEKYGELMAVLNDLIEQEKQLGAEADKLREKLEKAGTAAAKEAAQKELGQLLARQNELNHQLNQQAERMENFVRDDPLYDVERELQAELREQAKTIRESVKQNDADTRDIAQRSAPENGPRPAAPELAGDFKKAADEQVKRLGGAEQQTEKRIQEPLEDLSAMQELVKDFNQFQALHQAQQALAEQAKACNRPGQLSREDQLSLKNLAATEKQIGDTMKELAEKMRKDAEAAKGKFPKAAQSAQAMADRMDDAQLASLAGRATAKMLSGKGEESYQAAERLKQEMEKLMGQCNSPGGRPQQDELDTYLRAQRGMNPGQTWAQMMRSRNFNRPGKPRADGAQGAAGEGQQGESGYSISTQNPLEVLGNESMIQRNHVTDRHSDRNGLAKNKSQTEFASPAVDKPENVQGVNAVNRKSGAVQTESALEEYHDVVNKYFKAITKEPKP